MLLAYKTTLPDLRWGESEIRLDPETVNRIGIEKAKRRGEVASRGGGVDSAPRIGTPSEFRDLLISIAESANAMPNPQKQKGSRFELAVVKMLSAIGLTAAKVPLSGGAGGAFSDDITLKWFDNVEARFEAKCRGSGFKELYKWLGDCSGLFLKADRKPPLVVLRMEDFMDLMRRAHANERTAGKTEIQQQGN